MNLKNLGLSQCQGCHFEQENKNKRNKEEEEIEEKEEEERMRKVIMMIQNRTLSGWSYFKYLEDMPCM